MKMGGGPKQFGIDAEHVPALLATIGDAGLGVRGLPHLQRLAEPARRGDLRGAAKALRAGAAARRSTRPRRCASSTSAAASAFPTSPASSALDLAPIGAQPARRWRERARRELPQARLVIELGRYLVGEAGVYVCRVVDRKVSRGQVFLVTDGGLHHHLAASGNFGQVIRKNYPVDHRQPDARRRARRSPRWSARCARRSTCWPTGWTCRPREAGDLVVVFQSGAYGLTASPTRFLSHPPPREEFL